VKAQDTDAALDVIAPLVGPETLVLSMQNGLNPPRIAERIGADKVLGAFINYPADWQGPGHVEQGGPARIWMGELDGRMTERLNSVGGLLSKMGDTTVYLTDNVYGYLWSKMIYALPLFGQALTDETIADIFSNKSLQPLLVSMCSEGVAVAEAVGIKLEVIPPFEPAKMRPKNEVELAEACAVMDRIADHQRPQVKQRTGIWRDIAIRHRPTEVDPQVGAFVVEGEKRGITTPLIRRLLAMVKEVERGERQRGLHNLEELDRHRVN
jgi:2-dehydropantoate 2-reductase